ncbi:GNAT family N-acetyltransferase [Streptomyces barkulensis]|uniref:GNAT family N-acetyltransferase n=1 Tax=Streptomyces barkulensis TaxID=1257026 RepID=UPI000C6CF3FF|nr:GNAT family N-acetyltransferase [Streptomyces barkulensis]
MEIVDRYGLSLALIEPHELAAEPWAAAAGRTAGSSVGPGAGVDVDVDVVRMERPPAGLWDELAGRGFLRKPATVTWVAELGSGEEEFLARLDTKARQDVRRARRRAQAAGLREVVEEPVSKPTLEAFLALYEERVARMRFGVPFALGYRDAVLHGPEKFCGVFAYAGDELAGGCLVLELPERDAAVVRFSAVSAQWRRHSLARALYFSAMRVARAKGYTRVTLGNEPNLLGHLTQPGLFHFKTGMGFAAVPSQEFGDPDGHDEADLVLSLRTLGDPTLVLAYAGPGAGPERPLAARLISDSPVSTAPYRAPFLASVTRSAPRRGRRTGA